MKKIIALTLIIAALALSLAACSTDGNRTTTAATEVPAATDTASPAENTPEPTEPAADTAAEPTVEAAEDAATEAPAA